MQCPKCHGIKQKPRYFQMDGKKYKTCCDLCYDRGKITDRRSAFWSHCIPTEPGIYLYRNRAVKSHPHVRSVVLIDGILKVVALDGGGGLMPVSKLTGMWWSVRIPEIPE